MLTVGRRGDHRTVCTDGPGHRTVRDPASGPHALGVRRRSGQNHHFGYSVSETFSACQGLEKCRPRQPNADQGAQPTPTRTAARVPLLDSSEHIGNAVTIMIVRRSSAEGFHSRFVTVDGMRVRYRREGAGPTVVLLHGSASSLYGMEALAQRLQSDFDVISPDLPGFGETGPRPDRDYRTQTYAATVARFLDAVQVSSCAAVGNSLGGNIAWNLAVDSPDRVSALVLINATGYPDKTLPTGMALARNPLVGQLLRRSMPRRAVARSLRQAVGPNSTIVDKVMIERTHRLWNRPGNPAAFVDFVKTDQPDRSARISDISAPTLVLRSAAIDGQHFARDIAGAVEKVHSSGGHLLPEEDPQWVAEAIRDFAHTLRLGGRNR